MMLFVSGLKATAVTFCARRSRSAPHKSKKSNNLVRRDFNGFANNPFFRGALISPRKIEMRRDSSSHFKFIFKKMRGQEKKNHRTHNFRKRNATRAFKVWRDRSSPPPQFSRPPRVFDPSGVSAGGAILGRDKENANPVASASSEQTRHTHHAPSRTKATNERG